MSSWMKSIFHFDDRVTCFTIGRTGMRNEMFFEIIKALNDNIDALEKYLLEVIERIRPYLKGAVILAISYDHCGMFWEMTISHSSLPPRKIGELLPRFRLERCDEGQADEPTLVK